MERERAGNAQRGRMSRDGRGIRKADEPAVPNSELAWDACEGRRSGAGAGRATGAA